MATRCRLGPYPEGHIVLSVPPGVTTWTVPVVAPAGTVAAISEPDTTVNVAGVPSKVTLVEPVMRSQDHDEVPTLPEVGLCFHKRASPRKD